MIKRMHLPPITLAFAAAARRAALERRNGAAESSVSREHADRSLRNSPDPAAHRTMVYDTAEGQRIRVVVHASGLSHPWSLAFLPDGVMLVTERDGLLRLIRNGVLDPKPVEGLPAIRRAGLAGLMDLALHPQFATNKFVYHLVLRSRSTRRRTPRRSHAAAGTARH